MITASSAAWACSPAKSLPFSKARATRMSAVSRSTASTSEELSSQAEQLQSTIAFFRLGTDTGKTVRQAARQTRPLPARKAPKALVSHAPTSGLALDMGRDDEDDEFERF